MGIIIILEHEWVNSYDGMNIKEEGNIPRLLLNSNLDTSSSSRTRDFTLWTFNLIDSYISFNFNNINGLFDEFREYNYSSSRNYNYNHDNFTYIIFNSLIKRNNCYNDDDDEKHFFYIQDSNLKVEKNYSYLNENMFYLHNKNNQDSCLIKEL